MWSPMPVRIARRIDARATTAANVPLIHSLMRPPCWNGGSSAGPRKSSVPDSAWTVKSVAGRPAYGPLRP